MASTRTKPAAERRSDLLAATKQVFLDKGVAATKIDDITALAGVAKGTFYLYFESKEAVLAALQDEAHSALVAQHQRAVAGLDPGDWIGRLDTWIASTIKAYSVFDRRLHEVLFSHVSIATPVRSGTDTELTAEADALVDLLRRGSEAGAFDLDDPVTTGLLLYSALHGATHLVLHRPDATTVQRLTETAQQLARRAVEASGDRSAMRAR